MGTCSNYSSIILNYILTIQVLLNIVRVQCKSRLEIEESLIEQSRMRSKMSNFLPTHHGLTPVAVATIWVATIVVAAIVGISVVAVVVVWVCIRFSIRCRCCYGFSWPLLATPQVAIAVVAVPIVATIPIVPVVGVAVVIPGISGWVSIGLWCTLWFWFTEYHSEEDKQKQILDHGWSLFLSRVWLQVQGVRERWALYTGW